MSVTQEVTAAVEELRREVHLPILRQKFASAGFGDAVATDENLQQAYAIGLQIYDLEQQQRQKVASHQGELMKFAYEQFPRAAAALGVAIPQAGEYDGTANVARQLMSEQSIKTAAAKICEALVAQY